MQYSLNGFTIDIDLARDELLTDAAKAILKDRYFIPGEDSAQQCFARASCSFASNQYHAQRLYNYASKNWFMFSTPILSNAGTQRGLPISCFVGKVDDSMEGILDHHYESGFLASHGGGLGADWSSLRAEGSSTSRGNVSTGVIPFIKMMDTQMGAVQQGSSRRGAYAAYMDISHPEIEEFIELRTEQGQDVSRRCLGIGFHHAVSIPDAFMTAVKDGTDWPLKDPHSGCMKKLVPARELWMKILIKRLEMGEPYLFFKDTANRALPQHLKDLGLQIHSSQLCSEIMLPTSKDRTAVCCLSSVNIEYYDTWTKDLFFIHDVMEMLDNALNVFIDKAPKQMHRAVESARRERSIGLGAMGFHTYLQNKGIPFESAVAIGVGKRIFKDIQDQCKSTNVAMGFQRGPAPDAIKAGLRFSHTNALAPNAGIAPICGNTSPSIEPVMANAYKHQTMSGSFLVKNKVLDKLLREKYNKDNSIDAVWEDITVHNGSVQHLDWMLPEHREVFKTAMELDQRWIIEHAAHRQPYIDQGQSVNLFIRPDIHKNDLHKLHFEAWEKGLKSLYYCRSEAAQQIKPIESNVTPLQKSLAKAEEKLGISYDSDKTCVACEG